MSLQIHLLRVHYQVLYYGGKISVTNGYVIRSVVSSITHFDSLISLAGDRGVVSTSRSL